MGVTLQKSWQMNVFLGMLSDANQAQATFQKRPRLSRTNICLSWGFVRTLDLFFSSFFMSKLWRMQWHAEAKWSGYNRAEMLNEGRGQLRVTGWRRSNKHTPCILLFAPTVISTDGFIYLQVVCVSLSHRCVLFGLTLMRLSRGRLLYIWSNLSKQNLLSVWSLRRGQIMFSTSQPSV